MKTLSNLLMSDFISMSCGKLDVLLDEGENVDNEYLVRRAHELSYEYKNIINPSACKAAILIKQRETERRAKIALYRLCLSMLAIGDVKNVREVLSKYISPSISDVELKKKIENDLQRVIFEQKRFDEQKSADNEEEKSEDEIRSMFDKEISSLMVFFKMPIDIQKISAGVYANMVNQAYSQVKKQNMQMHK